jgi:hypothetical protein
MRWAFVSAVLLFVQPVHAQVACQAGMGMDASSLCVALRVDKGRLQADPIQSVFKQSAAFAPPRLKMRVADARRQMIQDLNALLAKLPAVFWFGLTTAEVDQEAAGGLTDAKTRGLRTFTGAWPQFLTAYAAWQAENPMRKGIGDLVSSLFSQSQGPNSDWGPLFLGDDPDPPAPPVLEAGKGIARFTVADPIGSWTSNEYEVTTDPSIMSRATLLSVLKPLEGTLWRPSAIRSRVTSYLTSRGYSSAVEVSTASTSPKFVRLQPGKRIAHILFSPPSMDHTDLDRGAYFVLEDAQFREYIRKGDSVIKEIDVPPKMQQVALADLGVAGKEPVFNTLQFQTNQSALGALGLKLSTIQREDPSTIDLLLEKQSDNESGDKARSAPAPVNISPEGVVRAPSGGPPPAVTAGSKPDAPVEKQNVPKPKNLKNWIGGGFEYLPGQGVRPLFVYQRTQLIGPSSLSVQSGTVNDKPVAFGNFFVDFFKFPLLKRRLSFQTSGSTDVNLNRQFYMVKADERRTGGFARAEVEWFRNKRGNLLKTSVEGRRATVELQPKESATQKFNLTTLDLSGTWLMDMYTGAHPVTMHVDPVVRWGLGLSATEPRYTRFGITGGYHQQMIGPTELDLTISGSVASEDTPLYELPSFGGEQSVRGFRRDDILARRLWAVQPEVWTPVPGVGNAVDGAGQFLRQNVRLAFFTDFGGVSHTLGPFNGVKAGPGVGLRIRYGAAVLKLDWAKGIGDAYSSSDWGRFYFSVVTTRAF